MNNSTNKPTKLAFVLLSIAALASAVTTPALAEKPRARALGIPFDGTPGANNAITDVGGVTVGYSTLIADTDSRVIRTGVTAILPRQAGSVDKPVFAGVFSLNGNGEMTGTLWIDESGFLEGPVLITNTHSVGIVRDAAIQWRIKQGQADPSGYWWSLPVVAETWDGFLNDINGFHVRAEHVYAALDSARGGAIAEGNVGGGTGMICHEFKCGTGTSSRVVKIDGNTYQLGALVQANYGSRGELRIAGAPIGKHMQNDRVWKDEPQDQGSIIIVVATDAPLLPHQLKRLARRAALGLARNGSYAGNGSGDIFIAFSTANEAATQAETATLRALGNEQMDPLFIATTQAVEESIINAMMAADTLVGREGNKAVAIDKKELQKLLKQYGRLQQ